MQEKSLTNFTNLNTDTSLLKIIALFFMLLDHIGASVFYAMELRVVGRIAFPLYAWCMVVGAHKTRNIYKYILRVVILGIISQPIYMYALNHTWLDFNIMFTLALALFGIAGIKLNKYGSQFILPIIALVVTMFIRVDYGYKGVLFIILLYLSAANKYTLFATFIAYALFWGTDSSMVTQLFGFDIPLLTIPKVKYLFMPFFNIQSMVWLALPFILIKTNSKIKLNKWLGYALYPLHLVIIILLKNLL